MFDAQREKLREDDDLIFSICLVDAIYLIAFCDNEPTDEQINVIKQIFNEDPILQDHKFMASIIADSLMDKLKHDFNNTANRIINSIHHLIDDKERASKILSYSINVAMAGCELPSSVQSLLEQLTDAFYLKGDAHNSQPLSDV